MMHHRSLGVGLLFLSALVGCASPELRQADRYAEEGKWDHAVVSYREALRKEPFDVMIQHRLDAAKTYAADDHYAEGRRALEDNRLADALRASRGNIHLRFHIFGLSIVQKSTIVFRSLLGV